MVHNTFSIWVRALRVYSYTCPLTPVLISAAVACKCGYPLNYVHLLLLIVAVVFLFAGANMVNEYFDFKKGVDTRDSLGSSKVLVDKLLTPRQVATASFILYAMAFCIGLYFVQLRGLYVLWLLLAGILGGYLYTGGPAAFKYIALGEPVVFCLMGPLLFSAVFYALTGTFSLINLLISIPVGLLIAAILTGNNLRDLDEDRASKINTVATLCGYRFTLCLYTTLIILAYVLPTLYAFFKLFSAGLFLIYLSVPPAIGLIFPLWSSKKKEVLLKIVQKTFTVQLIYSVLLCAGIILES